MGKALLVILALAIAACGQVPGSRQWSAGTKPAPTSGTITVTVGGDAPWTNSGLDVHAGDTLVLDAASTDPACNAEGQKRSWRDLVAALPVNAAGRDALVGRIGDAPAVPFLVGTHREITAAQNGRLFLGINQPAGTPSGCTYSATIKASGAVVSAAPSTVSGGSVPVAAIASTPLSATAGATPVAVKAAASPEPTSATPTPAAVVTTTSPVAAELFDKVPRRVSDNAGNAGDMVNFMIIGPQQKMEQAFHASGWVQVDRTKSGAAIHALLSSLSKQAYTEMPMSELYLFGRPQDYGFAQADPLRVVQSRHHLRVWKAPFEIGGQEVWVGAATHDIGFEKDNRNGGVTHKIDPAIDGERDFLAKSFEASGSTKSISYVTPKDPLTEAKTATGGTFHSDGRVIVMVVK